MKYLFSLLLFTTLAFAQSGFERGNELYRNEQFSEAIKMYEMEIQKGQESSELYFNIANCYYKLNEIAPSIYNYEKALLLSPDDKEIKNNLIFAKNRLIDEIKEIPKVGFDKIIHDFTSIFYFDTWAYISVGLALLFLALFTGYYFSAISSFKKGFFGGMFVVLILIIFSVASAFYEKSLYENHLPAIIFAENTQIKSEPKALSNDIVKLHEGTKVFVLEKLDDWRKVELTDGTVGWILSSDIKELK